LIERRDLGVASTERDGRRLSAEVEVEKALDARLKRRGRRAETELNNNVAAAEPTDIDDGRAAGACRLDQFFAVGPPAGF
jgi:hypothetical protein